MQYQFDREESEGERERIEELSAMSHDLFGEKNVIVWREATPLATTVPDSEFNFFTLSNALVKRDRRQLWLGFQRALFAGISPEEIFWRALWWPVRRMKDGPLAARLVAIWHETKREAGRDFGLELERFVLTI